MARPKRAEDRTQACRPQEEVGEAVRSRRPLRRDRLVGTSAGTQPVRAVRELAATGVENCLHGP